MSTVRNSSVAAARLRALLGNNELLVAVLMGLVSIGIAYASFQASLYDSQMAGAYSQGNNLSTEAESMYLEGNQQFAQDTQVWNQLTELSVEAESSNKAAAATAQHKYDVLRFQAVSDDFAKAITWSDEKNAADPAVYTSPLDNEDYLNTLFSGYDKTKAKSQASMVKGDEYNSYGDRLTLNTVLMSISLFLLGISAVLRQRRVQLVLLGTGAATFLVAAVMTATIPVLTL